MKFQSLWQDKVPVRYHTYRRYRTLLVLGYQTLGTYRTNRTDPTRQELFWSQSLDEKISEPDNFDADPNTQFSIFVAGPGTSVRILIRNNA